MKKLILLPLLICSLTSFSQEITRGPEIGEIYFMGPTATVLYDAIYRSTDFGETAVCVDSVSALTNTIGAIAADKTHGGLYFTNMGEALYYSPNYGQYGTWEFKHSNITSIIRSGETEGHIYKHVASHSENYGLNFISHNCYGLLGFIKDAEIDVTNNVGYCITRQYNIPDTIYFLVTFDNYDTLELYNKLLIHWSNNLEISRSNIEGNIYLCDKTLKNLYFTNDYGENWIIKNTFTCPNLPIEGITGGRQYEELYMLVVYLQMMGQRCHVYIYHSLDYGETFTVYHSVSIGPDPIYADFIASDTLVEPGDTIQFTDLSNDAESWEWDFNNDGTVDSYEQNPVHSYQDTGYYSVRLTITGEAIQDYGIRYNYIHVANLTNINNSQNNNDEFILYPNPVKNLLNVVLNNKTNKNSRISIYNLSGELVKFIKINKNKDLSKNIFLSVSDIPTGIYFIKVDSHNNSQTKKIIITR